MRGNKFNLLGALNGEVRKAQAGEKVKPREVNMDPNRLSWPYLKVSELKKDVAYTMRLLPAHPTKNPNGYVRKEMYQIPMKLDMEARGGWARHQNKFVMVPGCLDPDAPDPINDILEKIYALVKGPSAFEFIKTGEDEDGNPTGEYDFKPGFDEPTNADVFRECFEEDEELSTYIGVISKTWAQNIMPVLLYASCDSVKNDAGYNRYTNFVPSEDETDENILTRKFQINDVKAFYDETAGFVTKLREKTSDPKDKKYVQWNHATEGLNFEFTHGSDKQMAYLFSPSISGKCPLPEIIADKLEVSDDNYPDLMTTELRNGRKTPDEMLNIFLESPYAEKLRPFGLLD